MVPRGCVCSVQDQFLVSRMNSQLFVPVSIVAGFSRVRALTSDVREIVKAIETSSAVTLSADHTEVKPNITAQRNTIILREISASTPADDVKGIFTAIGKEPVSVRSDVGDIWFVTMEVSPLHRRRA